MTRATVDIVLFDIGGVLADFAGLPVMRELTGAADELEVAARWLASPWVRRFEAGACTEQEFADGIVAEWAFPFTGADFLDKFQSWLGDPFDGAEQMVRDTATRASVGCLSNTNSFHWKRTMSRWPLSDLFEYRFFSYELGAVKPDPEIFELALARLPVGADRVLFIDDNAVNVEAATASGMRAEQARGVAEARAVLGRHQLLG